MPVLVVVFAAQGGAAQAADAGAPETPAVEARAANAGAAPESVQLGQGVVLRLTGQATLYVAGPHGGSSEGQPKPVVASVLRSDGRLPARTGLGVPNYRFPESCPAVLARAAQRREWLSRPLGEPPRHPDLDGPAARTMIASFLDPQPAGGWLARAAAEALLATHGIPSPPRIAAGMSSARLPSRRKSALQSR